MELSGSRPRNANWQPEMCGSDCRESCRRTGSIFGGECGGGWGQAGLATAGWLQASNTQGPGCCLLAPGDCKPFLPLQKIESRSCRSRRLKAVPAIPTACSWQPARGQRRARHQTASTMQCSRQQPGSTPWGRRVLGAPGCPWPRMRAPWRAEAAAWGCWLRPAGRRQPPAAGSQPQRSARPHGHAHTAAPAAPSSAASAGGAGPSRRLESRWGPAQRSIGHRLILWGMPAGPQKGSCHSSSGTCTHSFYARSVCLPPLSLSHTHYTQKRACLSPAQGYPPCYPAHRVCPHCPSEQLPSSRTDTPSCKPCPVMPLPHKTPNCKQAHQKVLWRHPVAPEPVARGSAVTLLALRAVLALLPVQLDAARIAQGATPCTPAARLGAA